MVKVTAVEVSTPPLAVPPLSESVTVAVALPFALGAGVKLSTPVAEIDGCTLEGARVWLEGWKWTVWPPSSAGPAEMAVAHAAEYAPESSLTVTLPPPVNDGASLTAVTVMVKVCGVEVSAPPLAVPPLSERVTVTVAVPFALAAGVKLSTPDGEIEGC